MLMLWLLAVVSQRAMSLQLRRLAGSPGRCVAGQPRFWLTPQLSAQQGYVIPAGTHTVEEQLLPGGIAASSAPVWMITAYALYAVSVSVFTLLWSCQQGCGYLSVNLPHCKWQHSVLIWFSILYHTERLHMQIIFIGRRSLFFSWTMLLTVEAFLKLELHKILPIESPEQRQMKSL